MPDSFSVKQTITRILQAPPGLERRTMHTRFFFWVTCLVFLLTLGLTTLLTGTWFFAWPISAQLTALALFVLFEPHLEKRLSPFYRGSDTLTNLAEKSRDEWTQLATNAADQTKHRTVQTVQRIKPPQILAANKAKRDAWYDVASPFVFPGVVLKDNGDFQIGLQTFPQGAAMNGGINGILVTKESGPEGLLRLEREGLVALFRYHQHQWQTTQEPTGETLLPLGNRIEIGLAKFFAYFFFPAFAGAWASFASELSIFGHLFWFLLGFAASLFYNHFFIVWKWKDLIRPSSSLSQQLFSYFYWTVFITIYNFVAFFASLWPQGVLKNTSDVKEPSPLAIRIGLVIAPIILGCLWRFLRWRQLQNTPPAQSTAPRTVINAHTARDVQNQRLARHLVPVVPWGGLLLPVDRTLTHFALIGSTRSGKTINMRLLMQAAIPNALAEAKTCFPSGRAVVFDPKSEFVPILRGMGVPADRIKVMNPFDRRCVPWDIAADTLAPSDADNVAAILVPEAKGDKNEHFFTETSRTVVSSVIQALHYVKGTNWSLRDFILVCTDFERVETLLAACPETQHNLRHLKLNSDTYGNILASLQVIVKNFRVVAACWHHSTEEPLSINEWMTSNSVLVLGHDDTKSTTFSTLNRCLIHKISNVILAPTNKTDPEQDRTWLFLDEARDLGKLTGIRELLTRGAGKGCTVVLGFQSINGMKHVFGEHEASEIVGQCDNIGMFRFGNDHDTAKWAAELIGRHERTEFMRTYSYTRQGGSSTGSNEQLQERFIIRPETLQEMPSTDRAHGLNGVFVSKTYGVIHASHYGVTGDMLFTRLLDREDAATPALLPRDSSEERLPAWSEEEEKRLTSPRDDDPPEDWIYKLGRIG